MESNDQDEIRPGSVRSGGQRLRIETPMLVLHRPHRNDLSAITREIGKSQVACNLAVVPHPYSFIDATNWFGGMNASWGVDSFTFGIYEKNHPDELIGIISIDKILNTNPPCPTLGFWLAHDSWGRGIMSEAVGALLAFVFERLKAPVVEATYLDENPASGRVMEKNGFLPVEQTLLWSRYQMAYLPGHLMRCEKESWRQADGKTDVLIIT